MTSDSVNDDFPLEEPWESDRIGSAERGVNPTILERLPSGYVAIGDVQFLPGYCVLLRSPQAGALNELDLHQRAEFLRDMTLVGDAIEQVVKDHGLRRINYEILGNTDEFVHAHVWPRYHWEPEQQKNVPAWLYPKEMWSDPAHQLSDQHNELRTQLQSALHELKSKL